MSEDLCTYLFELTDIENIAPIISSVFDTDEKLMIVIGKSKSVPEPNGFNHRDGNNDKVITRQVKGVNGLCTLVIETTNVYQYDLGTVLEINPKVFEADNIYSYKEKTDLFTEDPVAAELCKSEFQNSIYLGDNICHHFMFERKLFERGRVNNEELWYCSYHSLIKYQKYIPSDDIQTGYISIIIPAKRYRFHEYKVGELYSCTWDSNFPVFKHYEREVN